MIIQPQLPDDPKTAAVLRAILAELNGGLGKDNLSPALQALLGAGSGSGGTFTGGGSWSDEFDTFDTSRYTVQAGSFSSSGGKAVAGANGSRARTIGLGFTSGLVAVKAVLSAIGNVDVRLQIGPAETDYTWVSWQGSDGNLVIRQVLGGGASTVLGTSGAGTKPVAGDNWMRISVRSGSAIEARVFSVDPDANPGATAVRVAGATVDDRFAFRPAEVALHAAVAGDAFDSLRVYR